jgi:hypothetical protein
MFYASCGRFETGDWLTHHEVNFTEGEVSKATPTDVELEQFYQDMSRLIHLLCSAVKDVHYDPEQTAAIRRRHARLFWAGVKGERTAGHSDYTAPSATLSKSDRRGKAN